MGINLSGITPIPTGGIQENAKLENFVQEVQTQNGEISLNLSKGLSLDLTKQAPSLKKAKVGIGWDANENEDIDLDVFALATENGKIVSANDIIFFRNREPGIGIVLDKDNRTGVGEGDDETILFDLGNIPNRITKIAVFVNIYTPNKNFGMVKNCYARVVDAETNKQEFIYILNEEGALFNAYQIANFVRNQNGWSLETIGRGTNGDINKIANDWNANN